jgi:hypothetical protein
MLPRIIRVSVNVRRLAERLGHCLPSDAQGDLFEVLLPGLYDQNAIAPGQFLGLRREEVLKLIQNAG